MAIRNSGRQRPFVDNRSCFLGNLPNLSPKSRLASEKKQLPTGKPEPTPKPKPEVSQPIVNKIPEDPPDRVEATEWERNARDKLAMGISAMGPKQTVEAKKLFNHPLADIPRKPTPKQLELVLELSQRLMVIGIVEKDTVLAKQYGTMAEIYRRKLGWSKDRFDQWEEPIFRDTCFRMGIKE